MFNPKEVKITDKSLLDGFFGMSENSIYNFTTLFMWSAEGKIRYDIVDNCLILFFYNSRNGVCCTYPIGTGDRRKVAEQALDFMKSNSKKPRFILMSEEMARECDAYFPEKFRICADRNNADYVYLSEHLIHLSGKKLHQKRNHFNAFVSKYPFVYKRIGQAEVGDCVALFEKWLATQPKEAVAFSKAPTMRLLENLDALSVVAGGIYVEGKLVAFSVGEGITDDMALIHVEYADISYRGAYNAINQQFVANEWEHYLYINREEDMGLEGLRRAKLAYRPIRLVEKFSGEYRGRS